MHSYRNIQIPTFQVLLTFALEFGLLVEFDFVKPLISELWIP